MSTLREKNIFVLFREIQTLFITSTIPLSVLGWSVQIQCIGALCVFSAHIREVFEKMSLFRVWGTFNRLDGSECEHSIDEDHQNFWSTINLFFFLGKKNLVICYCCFNKLRTDGSTVFEVPRVQVTFSWIIKLMKQKKTIPIWVSWDIALFKQKPCRKPFSVCVHILKCSFGRTCWFIKLKKWTE